MHCYIDTEEGLVKAIESVLDPYSKEDPNNILACDLETFLTTLAGNVIDEDLEEEEEEDEYEGLSDLEIEALESLPENKKKKKKKKPNLIPRPLLLKNGTFSGQIRTLALGFNPMWDKHLGGLQIVIDVQAIGYATVAEHLKPYLETMLVMGHNLKYDFGMLFAHMGISLKRMLDTMIAAKVVGNGIDEGFSLADLYDRCLDFNWFFRTMGMSFKRYKLFKKKNQEEENWAGKLKATQIKYAADDVFLIFYVWEALKARIRQFTQTYETDIEASCGIRGIIKLECDLIAVIAHAELRGVKLDHEHHAQYVIPLLKTNRDIFTDRVPLTRTYQVKKSKGRKAFKTIWFEEVTEKVKLTSHEQLKVALYDLLKPYGISDRHTIKWNKVGKEQGIDHPDAKSKIDKAYITFTLRNDKREWEEEIEINTKMDTIKRFVYDPDFDGQIPESVIQIIKDVMGAKQALSLLSKFGQKLIDCCTDRGYIHCNFNPMGTESGRFSSNGPNMQQILGKGELMIAESVQIGIAEPIKLASLFRASIAAEKGWKLVVADYAQLQARLAALFCNATDLLHSFNNDPAFDIHGDVAQKAMKLDHRPDKHSSIRKDIGKTLGFSILFGAFPKKLMRFMRDKTDNRVNWDLKDATEAHANFFEGYPDFDRGIKEYRVKVEELPLAAEASLYPFRWNQEDNRTVPFFIARSMGRMKRPRMFAIKRDWNKLPKFMLSKYFKMDDEQRDRFKLRYGNLYSSAIDQASREGFNHEIQGGEAILFKIACIDLHKAFIEAGFPIDEGIIIFNHDEFVVHCREERAELAKTIMEKVMAGAGPKAGFDGVKIVAEADIGDNWFEAKG